MKSFLALALVALCVTRSDAAAPDSLAGYILHTNYSWLHTVGRQAIQFASDGTYQQLYSYGGLLPQPLTFTEVSSSGHYTYTKLDDANATLLFSSDPGLGTAPVPLHFSSDSAGDITNGTWVTTFSLSRLDDLPPLVNCSNRSFLRAGGTAFAGFVIHSADTVVLARAIGPGLARFGLTECLAHPVLRVRKAGDDNLVAENQDWTANTPLALTRVGALVGAFPLANDSKDAATLLMLQPGAYICEVSSTASTEAGEVMIELYLLP